MTPYYTLWDVDVANSLGTYGSTDEALAIVHKLILANGPEYADVLELGYEDGGEEGRLVASGSKLRELARAWATNAARSSLGEPSPV